MAKQKNEPSKNLQNEEVRRLFQQFPECKELYRIPSGEYFTEKNLAAYNEPDVANIEVFKKEDYMAPEVQQSPIVEPLAE